MIALRINQWQKFLFLFLSTLLMSTTVVPWVMIHPVVAQEHAQFPEALNQCFPSPTGIMADEAQGRPYHFALLNTQPVLESDQRLPYRQYYLFITYWHDMSSFSYTLIALDNNNTCHRLVDPWSGFNLTYNISFDSAKQLALIYYGWLNSTPEGQVLVRALIVPPNYEDEEEDILYLSAEQGWVLQQLGYTIHPDYEILPPNTPELLREPNFNE